MLFSVGYSTKASDSFVKEIIALKDGISEVYFSWGTSPSGRNDQTSGEDLTPWEMQEKQITDLTKLNKAGLKFNLLFNANCYGERAQSRAFFHGVGQTVEYLKEKFNLASVTTTSPLIAKFIKQNFNDIDIRASVNMSIGSVLGLEYLADEFDSFYLKRELNRDFAAIKELRSWCDKKGKQMYILANSGCLNDCSAHTFHDNLVAHEKAASEMDNGYQFAGVCKRYLAKEENRSSVLSVTNFIRPEDTKHYEGLVPAMKLATRVHKNPERILNAYIKNQSFSGNALGLLEPDHSGVLYPYLLENKNIQVNYQKEKLIYTDGGNAFVKLEDCYVDEQDD